MSRPAVAEWVPSGTPFFWVRGLVITAHLFDWQRRFWSKVEVAGADECWLWRPNERRFHLNGVDVPARHLAWELLRGHSVRDHRLLSTCRNRRCVNPAHARVGERVPDVRKERVHRRGPNEGLICARCEVEKPDDAFGVSRRSRTGRHSYCRQCMAGYDRMQRGVRREDAWRRPTQEDTCAVCGAQDVVLDHDHVTGRARGWLCDSCNQGLGAFGDDPSRLRKAATYLEGSN